MCISLPQSSRGAVLASALILLVSLTLIAVTVSYRATMDELIAANQRDALNAMSIADSGLEAGYAFVEANYSGLEVGLCSEAPRVASLSGGNYTVTFTDCVDGDRAVINSVGTVNGAERQLELAMEMYTPPTTGAGSGNYSFLANDYISIATNYFVGPLIHIHTFGTVKVSGAPYTCVSWADCPNLATAPWGYLTARGYDPKTYELVTANPYPWDLNGPDMDGLGTPDDNPYDIYAEYGIDPSDPNADALLDQAAKDTIPHVYPPDWQPFATIELTADCRVVAGNKNTEHAPGTEIWNVSSQGAWNNWTCSSQSAWSVNSEGTPYDAFYYVHGNVKAKGSGSKQVNGPWNATFVTTGYFESGCCPAFGTWGAQEGVTTGDPTADNIFLLAGNDIIIQSAPDQVIDGIIAAHREVKLDGSQSHYRGAVIAENGLHHDYVNFPDSDQEVVDDPALGIDVQTESNRSSINVINSNTVLEGTGLGLNGGGGAPPPPILTAAAWREVVD